MNWLVKEEPSNYSFAQLQRDKTTMWSGVRNPLAQKHLKAMKKGDLVFFYHTGAEKAVVGVAKVMGTPGPDPADSSGRLFAVEIGSVKALGSPVTLAAIKAERRFADFPLVRMPRLSVMPVPDEVWDAIVGMGRTGA